MKDKKIKEKTVTTHMLKWLKNKGYTIPMQRKSKKNEHGVDIARRNKTSCRYWFIECKGYPGDSKKSQRYNYLMTVIGQIISRMKQKHGKYGIALGYSKYYHDKLTDKDKPKLDYLRTDFKKFRRESKVHVFLIKNNAKVYQLTPNSKKFKHV